MQLTREKTTNPSKLIFPVKTHLPRFFDETQHISEKQTTLIEPFKKVLRQPIGFFLYALMYQIKQRRGVYARVYLKVYSQLHPIQQI